MINAFNIDIYEIRWLNSEVFEILSKFDSVAVWNNKTVIN